MLNAVPLSGAFVKEPVQGHAPEFGVDLSPEQGRVFIELPHPSAFHLFLKNAPSGAFGTRFL